MGEDETSPEQEHEQEATGESPPQQAAAEGEAPPKAEAEAGEQPQETKAPEPEPEPEAEAQADAAVPVEGKAEERHLDVAENLEELSTYELLHVLTKEEEKVRKLQARIKKAKVEAVEKRLRDAELKKFSKKERASIRTIFDTHDTDGSGHITREEFGKLCTEMGYTMTADELRQAVESINLNSDTGIDFDEFLLWWGASADRGGNKGAKLDLVKAKLRAQMLSADLQKHMQSHCSLRSGESSAARKQTLTFNARVGDQGDEEDDSRYKTSCQFTVIPSDPLLFRDEATRLFPEKEINRVDEGGDTTHMRYCIEVLFERRENATEEDINCAVAGFNDAFEMVSEDSPYSFYAAAVPSKGGPQIRVAACLFLPPDCDPLQGVTSNFFHVDDPDACGHKLFTVASVIAQTRQDGENFLKWDCETPLLELMDQASVHAHMKLSSQVNEVLESYLFAHLITTDIQSNTKVRGASMSAAMGRLFEGVEISIESNSTREAIETALDSIATFPLKVAMKRGTFDDAVANETAALKERFRKNIDDVFKTEMTVPALMAKVLKKLLHMEEYTTALQDIGNTALGLQTIKVNHPLFAMKTDVKGFPFFKYMFQDDVEEMMERAADRRRETKAQAQDSDDLFPATKRVLDEAGSSYGDTLRAILQGRSDG